MNKITKPTIREIIDDFANEINERIEPAPPPNDIVIEFREERVNKTLRKINLIPIGLLRYRKNNGRIASDV